MLHIVSEPPQLDVLHNSLPFVVKHQGALGRSRSAAQAVITLQNAWQYTGSVVPVFSAQLGSAQSVIFYLVPWDTVPVDGISIRAVAPGQTLTGYVAQVITDLRKNPHLTYFCNVSADTVNPRNILLFGRYAGSAYTILLSKIDAGLSGTFTVFHPAQATDNLLPAADYHTKLTMETLGKSFTVTARPSLFDADSCFTKLSPETALSRFMVKQKKIPVTFPAPGQNPVITHLDKVIAYTPRISVHYNNNVIFNTGNLPVKYVLAGGVSETIKASLTTKGQLERNGFRFLTNRPSHSLIHPNEPLRLYFVTRGAGQQPGRATAGQGGSAQQVYASRHRVRVVVYPFSGEPTPWLSQFFEIPAWSIAEICCGFNELRLQSLFPNLNISHYSVEVVNNQGIIIAQPLFFYPQMPEDKVISTFLFYNSFGVPEFVSFAGLSETDAAPAYETILNNGYFSRPNALNISGNLVSHNFTFRYDRYFTCKNWLADFAASCQTWHYLNGAFIPVQTQDFASSMLQQYYLNFSFSFSAKLENYTPGSTNAFIIPPDPPEYQPRVLILEDGTGGVLLENADAIILENNI